MFTFREDVQNNLNSLYRNAIDCGYTNKELSQRTFEMVADELGEDIAAAIRIDWFANVGTYALRVESAVEQYFQFRETELQAALEKELNGFVARVVQTDFHEPVRKGR